MHTNMAFKLNLPPPLADLLLEFWVHFKRFPVFLIFISAVGYVSERKVNSNNLIYS